MLKKLVIGAPLAGVVLIVALAAGWWFLVREDAQLATAPPQIPASLTDASTDTSSVVTDVSMDGASTGAVAYTVLSESSEAAYFADEQLASIGVPSTAKGATNAVTGTFYLTEDGWSIETTQPSTFTVDLSTLESGEDRRDNRVQEALETGIYPTATFIVMSTSGIDGSLDPAEQQTFQITGILDLHGVQKEVTWDVEARREGNVLTALATTNFLYEDFGIPILNIAGFVSVEQDVTLQMQIIAQSA